MPQTSKKELRKFVAPEVVFGVGSLELAGRYAAGLGAHRVLLVTDAGVTEAGWAGRVQRALEDAAMHVTLFADITANPNSTQAMNGAGVYLDKHCDAIVSVGGGSPTDCAKAIGIVVNNGGHVLDYTGVDRIDVPIPPLVCVPTTSGASADVSQFAIVTDEARAVKRAVISKAMVPDVSLVDPLTLTTMPRHLTACTVLDALTHAIEAYVSNGSSPLTDVHAMSAMSAIVRHFERSLMHLDDLELRGEMMMASLHAGLAFSNASLGAVHAMAHSLGGLLDLPHGHCNALLLPHVVESNFSSAPQHYRGVAEVFGIDPRADDATVSAMLVEALHGLCDVAGIESSLAALGVAEHDLAVLSRLASDDPCVLTNPRSLSADDILRVYERAM